MTAPHAPAYDLTGRVAIVTGGNRGIGLGIARALAGAGAAVAVWGRDADRNAEAVAALAATGCPATAVTCDVSDEAQVASSFAATVAALGPVDVLVANAGMARAAPFVDTSLASWRRVMATNLDGAFLCLREAARHLVDRGEGGALLAVSSVSAIDGAPGMQAYAASKAGLVAMMRGLAVELARHRVRCNTILPGWTETEMNDALRRDDHFDAVIVGRTPVRRWGTPDEIGRVALFLADPSVEFHTGDTVVVDGGYTIC